MTSPLPADFTRKYATCAGRLTGMTHAEATAYARRIILAAVSRSRVGVWVILPDAGEGLFALVDDALYRRYEGRYFEFLNGKPYAGVDLNRYFDAARIAEAIVRLSEALTVYEVAEAIGQAFATAEDDLHVAEILQHADRST